MSIVTKESNPELYNSLFEDATIEDAKKVMQNMFNDITPEQFEELKKQAIENVKKNNMSAKEIFENLGYKQEKDDKIHITYYNGDFENKQRCDKQITFDLDDKSFIAFSPYERNDYEDCSIFINIEELRAINKQVEELGWYER